MPIADISLSIVCSLPTFFRGVTQMRRVPQFKRGNINDIRAGQDKHKAEDRCDTSEVSSRLLLVNGAAYITDEAFRFKLWLLAIAQTGAVSHRGATLAWQALRKQLNGLINALTFVLLLSCCLLFVLSKSGNRVPSSLSATVHASKLNEITHLDYVFLGQSDRSRKYALTIEGGLGHYVLLEKSAFWHLRACS